MRPAAARFTPTVRGVATRNLRASARSSNAGPRLPVWFWLCRAPSADAPQRQTPSRCRGRWRGGPGPAPPGGWEAIQELCRRLMAMRKKVSNNAECSSRGEPCVLAASRGWCPAAAVVAPTARGFQRCPALPLCQALALRRSLAASCLGLPQRELHCGDGVSSIKAGTTDDVMLLNPAGLGGLMWSLTPGFADGLLRLRQ